MVKTAFVAAVMVVRMAVASISDCSVLKKFNTQ